MFFDETGGLTRAAEAASSTFMAGIGKVNQIAVEHCVSENPHAMLWLFQIFALPSGLYGAQIWSTKELLKQLKKPEESCDLTRKHLSFIKRALGVKQSTTNLVALREAGKLPLHYYWLRMIVKFWNACTAICEPQSKKKCPLLHDMLRSDILLAENNGNCWSRDLLETVCMLLPGTTSDSILSEL